MPIELELSYLTTYVDPQGVIYNKGKVYSIDEADEKEFMSQMDERGVSFFRRFVPPDMTPKAPEVDLVAVPKSKRGDRKANPESKPEGVVTLENGVGRRGPEATRKGVTVRSSPAATDASGEIDTAVGKTVAPTVPTDPVDGVEV